MLPKAYLTSHSRISDSVSDHTIVAIDVIKTFFCIVLLCILATSFYLLLLLGLLFLSFIEPMFA